ncbi:MAG TPA: hypothetical protein VNW92_07775 [Polyangiaceae bacterium]|jgi:hypothetical protein|nr:hypothetical protein [Polyangiaceae bacterium]
MDVPRGPDVVHRIRVPRAWLEAGEVVEFELPRNLSCAACNGGGCDVCERAGAVALRGRNELPELLSVTLPTRKTAAPGDARGVVIRIPEQGGLPAEGLALPRGLLLLRVELAEAPDPGVSLVRPPSVPAVLERVALSLRVPKPTPKQARSIVVAFAIVVVLALALLAFWRLRR